jgi:hypothetical protein
VIGAADGALGNASANGITVQPGGSLAFSQNLNYTTAEPVSINGQGVLVDGSAPSFNIGALAGNNDTFAGNVTLLGDGRIETVSGSGTSVFKLTGTIALGGHQLTVGGHYANNVNLAGTVTDTGGGSITTLSAGTSLTVDGTLPGGDTLTVGSGTTLYGNGSVGNLVVQGTVQPGDPRINPYGTLTASSANFSGGGMLLAMFTGPSSATQSNQLALGSGSLTLGGSSALNVNLSAVSYAARTQSTLMIVSAGAVNGTFGSTSYINQGSIPTPQLNYGATAVTVKIGGLTVGPTTLATATANSAYSATFSASGGSGSYSFVVSAGLLPFGLSLNGTTGVLSGMPTTTCTSSFTITATDTGNSNLTGLRAYTLTVNAAGSLMVNPTTLANATALSAYCATLVATGGSGRYNFAVSAGALPSWLSLNGSTGVLSGTPTATGTSSFTIMATDAGSLNLTGSRAYTLNVGTSASTYYVATTGNDFNNGSAGAPFATLQHAMMSLQPGVTLNVEAGSYQGFVVGWDNVPASGDLYGTINGTASAPITIQADPAATPGSVIINFRNSKTETGIDLEPGNSYITISGFVIDGSAGLSAYPSRGQGMKIAGSSNVVVSNCTITSIGYGFGIIVDNASYVVLKSNTVAGTGAQGDGRYGHGIYISGSTDHAVVQGNVIHGNEFIGIHVNGDLSEGGIGLVTNALIAGNSIYNNGQNGINCDGIQSSTIENNLIYGYTNFGICLYKIDAGGPSKNNIIVNNTIVSTVSGAGAAIRILDGGANNTILNNILLGGGGVALRISSDSMSSLVCDYNIGGGLYQSEDTGNNQTLAQWQASTGQDAHSFTATAAQLFANAAANNYQLSSTSLAIDSGTATDAPNTDILGNPRPSGGGFDIGAYEHIV